MKLVAVLSQKGGGGKTTIATNIAVAAAVGGESVVLIDMDPQQSAVIWGGLREETAPKTKGALQVWAANARTITTMIAKAKRQKADLVVIDTPPAATTLSELAARAAHVSLVVIRPSLFDMATLDETFALKSVAKGRPFVVFNQAPEKGPYLDEARKLATMNRRPLAPVALYLRPVYQLAPEDGLGVIEKDTAKGAGRAEVKALYDWLKGVLAKTGTALPDMSDDLLGGLK